MSKMRKSQAGLTEKRRELFKLLLEERGVESGSLERIPKRRGGEESPLSYAQERLWFLEQLEEGNTAYTIPTVIGMKGELDVGGLERSVNRIIERHETLRTTFRTKQGKPVQVIHAEMPLKVEVEDYSDLPEEEKQRAIEEAVAAYASQPFDLKRGPLIRAKLLRRGPEEQVLVVSMHHIISDAWSMGVLVKEVVALYDAFRRDQPSPLAELPVQYADFAAWQRQWLQGDELDRQLSYWKAQLAGAPPVLELPTDKARPAVQSYRGAIQRVRLSRELSQAIKKLSQEEAATEYMVMMAAYKVMLMRLSGQQDMVVGTPIANRTRKEVEGLIGFFVNTLVMRTDLGGEASFREAVRREREVALGAYAHQDLPFEKVVEELQPERDQSRTPLFQVMFVYQKRREEELRLGEVETSTVGLEIKTSKFDLTLSLAETREGLEGAIEYSTDLFEEETIKRMAGHFEVLLESIVADPEQNINDLPLLTPAERRQILITWNQTAQPFPRQACIHELFEAQVEISAEAIAVESGEQALSYRELNERANQLGHYLRRRGVGAEVRVGICLSRRIEMVVAVLGVLKAGGAYVPLDPEYPAERLAFMVEDSGAWLVISERQWSARVREWCPQVVEIEEQEEEIGRQSRRKPESGLSSGNLAYVIYTSGSTGRPKGVAIEHRNTVALLAWAKANYGQEELRSVVAATSICFDLSVYEMLVPLVVGGKVEVVSSLLEVGEGESGRQGSLLNTVPSGMEELVRRRRVPESVETVNLAGEALEERLVKAVYEETGVKRVVNLYGPTECTTYSTYEEEEEGEKVSIGRPIWNTRVYVRDGRQGVVAVGVEGEIYIGGEGVARGYMGRAEQTAERFMPEESGGGEEGGGRMYRTGDRGRYRRDGKIEYRGRGDEQVKVRGYRIELGEVEGVMREQEEVRDAVVVVKEDEARGKLLVGYVVWKEGKQGRVEELKREMKEKLPEYMVPGIIEELEEMPLMPNGKVDRRELRAREMRKREVVEEREKTEIEEVVAGIWGEILGVEEVGVEANFFDLGGHSLLATQVISRVRDVFGKEVGLRRLFENSTLESFAHNIQEAMQAGEIAVAPPLERLQEREGIPLSYAQQRLWFLYKFDPSSTAYNLPAAIRFAGQLDIMALEKTLSEIVRRHEGLRTTFTTVNSKPVQVISSPREIVLEIINLRDVSNPDQKAYELAQEEVSKPFNLEHGPLLRIKILEMGEEDHIVIVSMHHIISDAWSMGVLVKEVVALYDAFRRDQPSPLAELPVQYADFAAWQRQWLQGDELDRQLSYWKAQLAGAPPVLELPTDKARPAVQSYRGAIQRVRLRRELSQAIKKLSQEEAATEYMVMMAAYKVMLMRLSGQADVVVGTPIANRTRKEVEGLIGFFVNTLVMRTDLGGEASFREAVRREREVALGAYVHQDLPFEKVVEELQPERDQSRTPLFQAVFVLQNTPQAVLELPGLSIKPFPIEGAAAQFDLILSLVQTRDGLDGVLRYSTDLFEEETIKRMAGHFEVLLESIVADPGQNINDLALLTAGERQQILITWNQTARPFARQACIHELFEAQVEISAEAIAVQSGEQALSYRQLNERANQLGHYLRRRGVGAEVRVGICLSRRIEMVVAVLGVLKAGGAYVPLDPEYPAERLAFMVEDSGAWLVISERQWSARVREWCPQVVEIEEQEEEIGRQSRRKPESGLSSGNLAYVIYTSGSTGRPKGVAIEHRGLVNHMQWMASDHALRNSDRVLQKTLISFDASVWEFYLPLITGAKIVMASPEAHKQGPALIKDVREKEITVLQVVPNMLKLILENPQLEACTSLSKVFCGGGELTQELRKELKKRVGVEVVNLYGPTETTIQVMHWQGEDEAEEIAIGVPIWNTRVYVRDGRLGVVPVGIDGEIYIGGEGVARGYVGRAEQTAERFMPEESGGRGEGGGRMYRTGDRGRYRRDGKIEYRGRGDEQVKVRGYRIELGEVEGVMKEQEEVRDAVVVVKEDEVRGKLLVGYVVWKEGRQGRVEELKREMKEKLPEYMVPGIIEELEEMPLMPNGKVDRRGLGARMLRRREVVEEREKTEIEEVVAGIWGEILGVEEVGVEDNFFDLGGHSLLAMRVLSRIDEAFNVEMELRSIFEASTVNTLSKRIEAEMLSGGMVETPPIVRVSRDQELPLSFAQQRLWFLAQLEAKLSAYNLHIGLRLVGPLKLDILQRCMTEIVRRHEALRTNFGQLDGRPIQVIRPAEPFKIAIIDLTDSPSQEHDARSLQAAAHESEQEFDLTTDPLLRMKVLRIGEEDHIVIVSMHHIISDAWSMGVLVKEVVALYDAFRRDQPSPLAELPVQYADFAAWQRQWLQGDELDRQLGYWKAQLAGAPPVLELPTDKARPAVQSYRGAIQRVRLRRELSQAIKKLSQEEAATEYMVMMAAYKVMLMRLSGQQDMVVGTPIANRTRKEVEGLIGFFVNTLVMRTDLGGEASFREAVRREREVALGAYVHQDLPFEKVVEELQPERDQSRTPLFQAMFVYQKRREEELRLEGVEISAVGLEIKTSKFDLTLSLAETREGLEGAIEYSTDLFEEETIKRMAGHFEVLLESIVANPEQNINDLPLLTAGERQQILITWNQTARPFARQACIHELFEAQVEISADAIAVESGEQALSYRELNERANQLGHYLRSRGVGAEVRVGICLSRRIEMVVAVLGVLKAGGAYVPLDPEYPAERLAFMLDDTQTPILLTQEHLALRLPESPVEVVCLDRDWNSISLYGDENLNVPLMSDSPTYVIFTSGSTGRPKGIVLPHRCLVNLICWHYTIHSSTARTLQFASLSFDASFHEIFACLIAGGTLFLISEEMRLDPQELGWFIFKANIEKLILPVVVLQQLAEEYARDEGNFETEEFLSSSKEIITTGEQLHITKPIVELFKRMKNWTLHNHYGPSETHVVSSYSLSRDPEEWETHPPIGKPISNTQLYVLDKQFQPSPVGVVGELFIGGDGLAQGYLNRAEITAERFIPNPFSQQPGERLYLTGDLSRFLPDGNIEFLGRRDHQVKIRGFRVEVEEIESVLSKYPAIKENVVVARDDLSSGKQLIAYVVAEAENKPSISELRNYLKSKLPNYMVPSSFVMLEELPLTPNGKIDRKALPDPDRSGVDSEKEFIEPRTAAEKVLAIMWAEVLRIERVSINENFFDLGGHSLLAAQFISRVREVFQIDLPLRSLFDTPVIADLVQTISQQVGSSAIVEEIAQTYIQIMSLSDEEVTLKLSGHDEVVPSEGGD